MLAKHFLIKTKLNQIYLETLQLIINNKINDNNNKKKYNKFQKIKTTTQAILLLIYTNVKCQSLIKNKKIKIQKLLHNNQMLKLKISKLKDNHKINLKINNQIL